jgi:hypothetical protein
MDRGNPLEGTEEGPQGHINVGGGGYVGINP